MNDVLNANLVNDVLNVVNYASKLEEALPETARVSAGHCYQLKKALLAVYGRRCDHAADSLPVDGSYTLGRLIRNELSEKDIIISFNYDTIVERLARKLGRPVWSVGAQREGSGAITLAKPHGSASWVMNRSNYAVTTESADGSPLLTSLCPEDVDEGREPLVLGTVPIKSELIREVQAHPGSCGAPSWIQVFKVIARQWKAVVEAVRDADSMVIVGYGFPRVNAKVS